MTMATAADYLVRWVYYSRSEGSCCTHAVPESSDVAICGTRTTEGAGDTIVNVGGTVSCRRCVRIPTTRGVLPCAVVCITDYRGNALYVAADAAATN